MDVIADLPEFLRGLIESPRRPDRTDGVAGMVTEGHRNDFLYGKASDAVVIGWPVEQVRLVTHGLNSSLCQPPLDATEVERIVASACRLDPVPFGWVKSLTSAGDRESLLNLVSGADLLTREPPAWLVNGVLPVGSVWEVVGPSDSYKSFVVLALLLSVINGVPWLGHKVEQTGPCVYVMAEGGADVGNRLNAWHSANPGCTVDGLHASVEEGVDLLDQDHVTRLVDELPDGTAVVVFDTLALHMPGGDENSAKDMGRVMANLRWLAKRSGASVGVVHHTGWDTSRERGSTANRGALDVLMQLEAGLLTNTKQTFGPRFEPVRITMREFAGSLVPFADDFEGPVSGRAEQLDAVVVMAVCEAPDGMTRDELVSALRRSRSEVLQSVRRCVRSGHLLEDRSGGGAAVLRCG